MTLRRGIPLSPWTLGGVLIPNLYTVGTAHLFQVEAGCAGPRTCKEHGAHSHLVSFWKIGGAYRQTHSLLIQNCFFERKPTYPWISQNPFLNIAHQHLTFQYILLYNNSSRNWQLFLNPETACHLFGRRFSFMHASILFLIYSVEALSAVSITQYTCAVGCFREKSHPTSDRRQGSAISRCEPEHF